MKKLISMLLAIVLIMGCVGINVFATGTQFTDVPTDAYYYDAVSWAVENGITKGTGNNKFSPGDGCTRGQVVTFLWRAEGSPKPANTDAGFGDVKSDAFYTDAVTWAVENDITKGTGADTFSPDATCTRGQIVTFLWRAKGSPKFINAETGFSDVKSNAYYVDAVKWAVENGITKGTGDNKFSPEDTCTRSQIVTFLYRAMVGSDIETEHKHEWVFSEYVGPNACQEGYNVYMCACGEGYKQGTGDVLECRWEAVEVVAPTTEEMGYTVYKCAVCGNTWTDYDKEKLPAETEPTPTEPADDGGTTDECEECDWVKLYTLEPTVDAGGYSVYYCHGCHWQLITDRTDPLPSDTPTEPVECNHEADPALEAIARSNYYDYWNGVCICMGNDWQWDYTADTREGTIALIQAHGAECEGDGRTHGARIIACRRHYIYPSMFNCIHCGEQCIYRDYCDYDYEEIISKEEYPIA